MARFKNYSISLPFSGKPNQRFQNFISEIEPVSIVFAQNWKGRLNLIVSSLENGKKISHEASMIPDASEGEVSSFASTFNVAMSLRDRTINTKIISNEDNSKYVLKVTITISSLAAQMVFENFQALAKENKSK